MNPPRFQTKTIEEVIDTLIDYRGKTPEKAPSGVKLITAKVIKGGRIQDDNHEFIAEEDYEGWMRRGLPRQWDILLTTEAPLGEVAQLRTTERVALAQRVILLRGNPKVIDQGYFFQTVKSPFVQSELAARATGTTVLGIKQSELRQVRIPLFPLPTQRNIAAILSAYDDLIENNTQRIQILERMAQALYREWFIHFRYPGSEPSTRPGGHPSPTGGRAGDEGAPHVKRAASPLGPIPQGWKVVSVPEAVFVNPKTTVPRDGEKPFVPMTSLSNGSMLIGDIESREGNSGSKFMNGDTLFARITPCLENGKTAFVQFLPSEDDVAFGSTEFIVLRARTVTPEYVYCLARSDEFRGNAIKSMSGATGRQRVQEACFEKLLIAQPGERELAAFTEVARPMFKLIHCLATKNTNLRRTRDLLLPKLISGALDVSKLDLEAA